MADTFRLARSTFIQAPPKTVHALVNDFHNWGQWSPWAKMDAGSLQNTYEGSTSGVGAAYGWVGPKTGTGRMQILSSTPEAISIQLDFIKPMKANNKADFTFTPEGEGTRVDWVMTGPLSLFMKIMGLFFSTEKMVGPQFEEGLANMKAVAEAAAPKPSPAAPKPAAPAKPKAAAAPKAAAKPAAPKAKAASKAPAAKAKPVAVKAAAKPASKPAAAKKPAAKAKPASKSKAPAAKT